MSSLNKVMLIGRAGADPEFKKLENDRQFTKFSVATSESYKAKDGTKTDKTEWHNIVIWGKMAEVVSKYVSKGSQVYVEGKLQTRSWDDKDGVKKYTTEIVADTVTFLDSKKSNGDSGTTNSTPASTTSNNTGKKAETAPATVTHENNSDDDLPF